MNEERILNQLSDHEKTLTLMSKVVEDINKNLDRFASANETLTKEMAEHWHIQDKIMTKMEAILESMSKYEVRFTKIEDRQINGCPNFINFTKTRDEQLKRYENIIESLTTDVKRNREEINGLINRCDVVTEKISVTNNRIKDLEESQKKGMWLIITAFLAILGTLIKTSME
jgi:primosomal protein N''